MRLVEALQVAGALCAAVGSVLAAVERRVVTRLRSAGATSPEAAIEVPARGAVSRWRVDRLRAAGAIHELGDGRMYLDPEAHARLRRTRRRRALVLAGAAVLAVVLILLLR